MSFKNVATRKSGSRNIFSFVPRRKEFYPRKLSVRLLLTRAERKSMRRILGHADRSPFPSFFPFFFRQPETAFSAPFVNATGFIVTQIRLCAAGEIMRELSRNVFGYNKHSSGQCACTILRLNRFHTAPRALFDAG